MIKKIVKIKELGNSSQIQEDLEYWLSVSLDKRLEAVEILRRQNYGVTPRLQRVVRIIDQV